MLIDMETLRAIRDGEVDLAFRRWFSPRVRVGGRMRTAVGELEVCAVEQVELDAISDDDARRAGLATRDALLDKLRREGDLYRVQLRYVGEDQRVALRENDELTDEEYEVLAVVLQRSDARSDDGPWTDRVLAIIEERPATLAARLAQAVGIPVVKFKRRVRRLKEHGLTISLERGYELSPRGRAYRARRP